MRKQITGTVVYRGANRWATVIDEPRIDGKRQQRWKTFYATEKLGKREQKKEAEAELAKRLLAYRDGTHVEPSELTVTVYLRRWLEVNVKPILRPSTFITYRNAVANHIEKSALGGMLIQDVRGSDIERYYAECGLSPESLAVHASVFSSAFRKAAKDKLITATPVVDLVRKESEKDPSQEARLNCWSAAEARKVIAVATAREDQVGCFALLALDSGARRAELDGLGWEHVDFDNGRLTVERQLDKGGDTPRFGPTKNKKTRVLDLLPETMAALRSHKQRQAELKMRNRKTYADHGLVFAREHADVTLTARLGSPIQTLGAYHFRKIVKAAGVKRITFHGCRHTVATISLGANVPPHSVADRLGHDVATLLSTYAHVTGDQKKDAAARLGSVLYG